MARFLQGTTDHDGDGKMGGSLKEIDMAKASTKSTAKPKAETSTVENGMEAGADTSKLRADLQKQFDKADAAGEPMTPRQQTEAFNEAFEKADPEVQAALVNEAEVGKQIRGY